MTELKALMIRWKSREYKAGRKHTLPDGLTQGMLGKRGSTMSLSGAEANGFLRFLMQCVVPTIRVKLVGGIWEDMLTAGDGLLTMLNILSDHKSRLPLAVVQRFHDAFQVAERAMKALDIPFVPKRHMTAHLVVHLWWLGAPAAFATWKDEQYNGFLKLIALRAHFTVWHSRLLSAYRRGYASPHT